MISLLFLLLLLIASAAFVASILPMKGYVYHSSGANKSFGSWNENISSKPTLNTGEVLVKVHAASLNPIDAKLPSFPLIGTLLAGKVVGQDFAGVVEESKSSSFKAGDKVYGFSSGTIAEKTVAKEAEIHLKPSSSSFIEAASLPTVALTSYQALLKGGTKVGSKVCVVGASGGCGLTGIQLARTLVGPTGKVAAICGTQNVDYIKSLGVTDVVADYKTSEVLVGENSPLASVAGGFDVLYDTVSSPESKDLLNGQPYDKALSRFLTPTTQTVAINGSAGRWINALVLRWEEKNFNLVLCKRDGKQLKEISDLVDKKLLSPVIDSVHPFSLAGVEQAYEKLNSRRARGKVVIDVLNGSEV